MIRSLTSQLAPALLLIGLSLFMLDTPSEANSENIPAGLQAGPTLISATEEALQFTLTVPEYSLSREGIARAPGLEATVSQPGAPELPFYSTLVALPPEADVTVEVQLQGLGERTTTSLRPAGSPAQTTIEAPQAGRPTAPPQLVHTADSAIYETNAYYPAQPYRLTEPMYYRDVRLVRLELFPLRYNPVAQTIEHATEMHVSVSFHGARMQDLRPARGDGDAVLQPLAPHVINFEQALAWRSLPADQEAAATVLPTGQEVFKIAVNENGIYEITCAQLRDAGMTGTVNPSTFEMTYRGQPVAYDFMGNSDTDCQDAEAIRFYGWAFDGSRLERQFLTENVFWLWAGGTALNVETVTSTTGQPLAVSFRDEITRELDELFTLTRTDDWEDFPNEADAWYWEVAERPGTEPVFTYTHPITLPTPAGSGPDAEVTVEILSRRVAPIHDVSVYLNEADDHMGNLAWENIQNVNVTTTVPVAALLNGANEVHTVYTTVNANHVYFMNRISVEYQRRFVAQNDRLIFSDDQGPRTYNVGNFSTDNALVWDIGDRRRPRQVQVNASNITGSGPYTYTFGLAGSSHFIATNEENLLSPAPGDIEKYVPQDLEPSGGGADWVAISYGGFMGAAGQLAAHRAQQTYGGLSTHVVDAQDVIEQYGYGLPLPAAIQSYLAHALANWDPAPRYVVLVGDGHLNPRQISCPTSQLYTDCDHWGNVNETNYVLTDLVFEDEFAGLIPSDYTFSLLSGDDLLPDVAVGRLAVNSVTELENVIDKIKRYESNFLTPEEWQRNMVFVADNPDGGGNFCSSNMQVVSDTIPTSYDPVYLCLPENPEETDVDQLRGDIHEAVNPPNGATFLNYRGHGAIRVWGGNPPILNLDEENVWTPWSGNEPLILLSMDCWDGNFATPGEADNAAISEVFLGMENNGTAAHWSSTGLGYDAQHTVLHKGFYAGLFTHGATTIGQAIDYSKLNYHQLNYHSSQLYSFLLQGDPAMLALDVNDISTYLPVLLKQ